VHDEPVPLYRASGSLEAEELCGLLRENGIRCNHVPVPDNDDPRAATAGLLGGMTPEKETVFVNKPDLHAAAALLADWQRSEPEGT